MRGTAVAPSHRQPQLLDSTTDLGNGFTSLYMRIWRVADSQQMLVPCPCLLILYDVTSGKLLIPIILAKAQMSYHVG